MDSPAPSMPRNWYLRPGAVVATLVLVGLVFLASTANEIRSTRAALTALTAGHAEQVRQVVSESQGYALAAFEAWEEQAGQRLLALVALIDHLGREGRRSPAFLDSVARANNLACLTVRRPDRGVIAAATEPPGAAGEAFCWDDLEAAGALALAPGEARVLRAPAAQGGGYRLIGALRKADGSIVCAGLDAGFLAAERRRIGPGRLLQALGRSGGAVYLALQDSLGILAATPNVERLTAIAADPVLAGVMASGRPASRQVAFAGGQVLEQVSRLEIAGRPVGLLRAAVDLSEVQRRQRELATSIAVHSLLLLAALGAGAALMIASRRLAVAQAAWARARREVAALEEERTRRERSVALGELASGVAHEIRNPLNAIHVIAQRLGREFTPRAGAPEYLRLTEAVREEVGRLNRIVEQFLQYARPPRPRPAPLDLAALVRDAVTLARGRFEARDVTLTAAAPGSLVVTADGDLLRQALHNLLDNALDACAPGARVTVTLERTAAGARLAVSDTGTGIAPEQLRRIFNLYHTTKADGTGMGLAIVDQVAAQHGGHVKVESRLGHGSTFTLELPGNGAPEADAGTTGADAP